MPNSRTQRVATRRVVTRRVVFQPDTYQGLQRGINQMANAVRPTLGPRSRIVAIDRIVDDKMPEMLDNGGVIVRRIIQLADRDEDVGAMFVRDVLWTLHDQVGDGTATAAVLLQSIFNHGVRYLAPPPFVSSLAISPDYARDGALFAATLEDGVFRSADRGTHWAAWNFGLLDLNVLALAVSPHYALDETLFAATESGIFRSTNGARAWREVDFPTHWAPVLSLALSPNYADDATLFAGSEAHGLFRSQDAGATWQRLAGEHLNGAVNSISLAPDFPGRPEVLVLHEDAVLVSRDAGQTWTDWPSDVALTAAVASLAAPHGLAPDAPLLVGLTDGSVLQI